MKFQITIPHERKKIRLIIEKLPSTKETERYKVMARNQSFVLQNNRPILISRGLKRFPIKWKVVEGGYHHSFILEQITKAIEEKIRE